MYRLGFDMYFSVYTFLRKFRTASYDSPQLSSVIFMTKTRISLNRLVPRDFVFPSHCFFPAALKGIVRPRLAENLRHRLPLRNPAKTSKAAQQHYTTTPLGSNFSVIPAILLDTSSKRSIIPPQSWRANSSLVETSRCTSLPAL